MILASMQRVQLQERFKPMIFPGFNLMARKSCRLLCVLLLFLAAASRICGQPTNARLATFQKFVNAELPVKEAVMHREYRELSSTNHIAPNHEWWRFGYQNGTWFVQRLKPDATNSARLVPNDSSVCGASFAQFWMVSDKYLYLAAKNVAAGSVPDKSGAFRRTLMIEALSLGVPRELNLLNLAEAPVAWNGLEFDTIVGSIHDSRGAVLATAPLRGRLKLGDNGLPALAEYPGVGQFSGGSVTYEYAPDTVGIPERFTVRYSNTLLRCEFLSLTLGPNELAGTDGYVPSQFADMKLKRLVKLYTNGLGYEQRDGKLYPSFSPPAPKLGEPAPELSGTHWLNAATPLTLATLHGKVVLLEFWSTTCAPCIEALPATEALYNKFKNQGLMVIGVCGDWGTEKKAGAVLKDRNITFPVMMDSDLPIADAHRGYTEWRYVLDCAPSYALVDKSGRLAWKSTLGILPAESQIQDMLESASAK